MRALVLALPLLAGCITASAGFAATNAPPRPLAARPPEEVAVWSAGKPDRPYDEVGVLSTWLERSLPDAVVVLRRRAAEVGCDAILAGQAIAKTFDWGDGPVLATEYTAACIVYR